MESKGRDSARSRSETYFHRLVLTLLFFSGTTAGVWVSVRYFDDPIAVKSPGVSRAPGRVSGHFRVPKWIDHPFRARKKSPLENYGYRAAVFDLNRLFFGSAMASIPDAPGAVTEDYDTRRVRGLLNADHDRVHFNQTEGASRALLGRIGRETGNRALASLGRAIQEDRAELGEDAVRAIRVPGAILYLAAAAYSGRPVRARIGTGTTIRTQTTGPTDFRFSLEQRITGWGTGLVTAYDTIENRRSVAVSQPIANGWAVAIDRTLTDVAERREDTVLRFQFSAPF